MTQGLQVWDANGNLTLDVTDRLSRVLGSIVVTTNGSLSHPMFGEGTPFYVATLMDLGTNNFAPNVTFSGTTMSWVIQNSSFRYRLTYGVY